MSDKRAGADRPRRTWEGPVGDKQSSCAWISEESAMRGFPPLSCECPQRREAQTNDRYREIPPPLSSGAAARFPVAARLATVGGGGGTPNGATQLRARIRLGDSARRARLGAERRELL